MKIENMPCRLLVREFHNSYMWIMTTANYWDDSWIKIDNHYLFKQNGVMKQNGTGPEYKLHLYPFDDGSVMWMNLLLTPFIKTWVAFDKYFLFEQNGVMLLATHILPHHDDADEYGFYPMLNSFDAYREERACGWWYFF